MKMSVWPRLIWVETDRGLHLKFQVAFFSAIDFLRVNCFIGILTGSSPEITFFNIVSFQAFRSQMR